jgi:Rrf2 family protein
VFVRLSEGVEWGVHCLVVLAAIPPPATVSAARLADFHGVPAPYLAKHLQGLSRAGIVDTLPGARGGYRLARPAVEISVLDAVLAVEGDVPTFRCTEIRRRGPAGLPDSAYRTVCAVHRVMGAAELAWRQTLAATTIADLGAMVMADASPEGLVKAAEWLQQAVH